MMTEKRFTHRKWYNERQLFDGEEPFAIVDIYIQSDKICDKLNEIAKENEQLKQQSDNKQKHIVTLENKIVRMRKAIHKLEWLSTHRNADLQRENEQLKQEVTHWKKILDNHQQIVAKTLREQYHWLKNEDKIQNNDKTVALLEIESISARLGIDLI